ncbi:MAG: hypothetical protein L0271_04605 [Gemmatimonadetes bacterium]|nr:hypothetical protein [Gemmatimonadota bacterium]
MRSTSCVLAATAALWSMGCRDGPGPFQPDPLVPDSAAVRQLTFSPGHDADPAFLSDDSLVYVAESFPGIPSGRGLLVSLSIGHGTARPFLPDVQGSGVGGPRWIVQPAIAGTTDRIAFVEVPGVATPAIAAGMDACLIAEPLLDSLVVRVRARTATGPLSPADPTVAIRLDGRDARQKAGLPGPWDTNMHPFQTVFAEESQWPVHPSWSPDGRSLAFSDGLRLLVWTVDGGAPVELPGTDDGVSPTWSPDGAWIAYTRLVRGASARQPCPIRAGATVQIQNRTSWFIDARRIELIRPDGSEHRSPGEGEDPAWSPDSRVLYVRRAGAIHTLPIDGGAATVVTGTELGRQPAVSPDGHRIAFLRWGADPTRYDVWIARLAR